MFSPTAKALREKYSSIVVSSEYTDAPAKFPAVTIIEADNSVLTRMSTKGSVENAAKILIEVNVFSNKTAGAKLEARDIMESVDNEISQMGFVRTMMKPTANLADATIYRITARYEGVIMPEYGVDETIYRVYTH